MKEKDTYYKDAVYKRKLKWLECDITGYPQKPLTADSYYDFAQGFLETVTFKEKREKLAKECEKNLLHLAKLERKCEEEIRKARWRFYRYAISIITGIEKPIKRWAEYNKEKDKLEERILAIIKRNFNSNYLRKIDLNYQEVYNLALIIINKEDRTSIEFLSNFMTISGAKNRTGFGNFEEIVDAKVLKQDIKNYEGTLVPILESLCPNYRIYHHERLKAQERSLWRCYKIIRDFRDNHLCSLPGQLDNQRDFSEIDYCCNKLLRHLQS